MGDENRIGFTIAIQGGPEAAAQLTQFIQNLGAAANGIQVNVQNAAGRVNTFTQQVAGALGMLNGTAGLVANALGMGLGGGALLMMGRAAAENVRQIDDLADVMGTSAKEAGGLAKAANSVGASLSALGSVSIRGAAALKAVKDGSSEISRTFYTMGIVPESIKTVPQLLGKVADFMRNDTRPEIEKLALVHEVLGRGVRELIPLLNQGGDALARYTSTVDEHAVEQAKQFNAQLRQLQTNVQMGVGRPVLEFINKHDSLTQFAVQFGIAGLGAAKILSMVQRIAELAPSIGKNLGTFIGGLQALAGGAALASIPWAARIGAVGGVVGAGVGLGAAGGSLMDDYLASRIRKQSEDVLKQQAELTLAQTDKYKAVRIRNVDELETLAKAEADTYRRELQGAMLYEQAFIELGRGTSEELSFAAARVKALGDAMTALKSRFGTGTQPGFEIPGGGGLRGTYDDAQKARDLALKSQAEQDALALADLKARYERALMSGSGSTSSASAASLSGGGAGRMGLNDYLDARWRIIQTAYRRDSAAARADLEQATASVNAAKGGADEIPKLLKMQDAAAKLKSVERKNQADILALEQEGYSLREAEEKQREASRVALAEASGQKLIAAREKIEQEYREKLRQAPGGDKAYADRLRQTRDLQMANAEETISLERLSQAEAVYNAELQKTANQVQAGQISPFQGRARNVQSARDFLPSLVNARQTLSDIHGAILAVNPSADVTELETKLQQLDTTLQKIKQDAGRGGMWSDFTDRIRAAKDEALDFGNRLGDVAVNGLNSLSQGFTDVIMGAKRLEEAMADVARAVIAELIQMAIKAALFAAVFAMLGGGGGFGGGFMKFFGLKDGGIVRAASGFVSGPGGPRDDVIPALLSNGEAVIPANRVAQNPSFIQGIINGAVNLRDMAAGIPSDIAAPIGEAAGYAGGGGFNGNINVAPAAVHVAVLNTPQQVRSFLESTDGRKVLHDITKSHLLDLGITS